MSTLPRGLGPTTAALALALALAGCGGSDPSGGPSAAPSTLVLPSGAPSTPAAPDAPAPSRATPTVPALPTVSANTATELQRVVDARAAAVLGRDRDAFLAGLSADPALRTTEGGYFDNLALLPISAFSYRVEPASLVRTGDSYWAVVDITLRLTPYDAAPVRTGDRFRFVRGPAGGYVIASTTDLGWEAANLTLRQPWETEPIKVQQGAGVLGVFDTAGPREMAGVVASVERGIADVTARVPYPEWASRAVVYALSDPTFLDSFADLPGGDPEALDGVAFTVAGGAGDRSLAATRIALSPDLLPVAGAPRVDPDLDRLVRHELVHVAVGTHDDASPVWLSEGVAEWVSVQALAPEDRDVPDEAVRAATRGRITAMPTDDNFNDDDAATHYALAWWVCEWLAQTYGPDAPFTVMDAFTIRAGDDPAVVVQDLLGMSVDELARQGAELMATTYAAPATTAPPTTSTPSSSATPTQDYTIYD